MANKETKARVYFKLWAWLDRAKQLEAFRTIRSKLFDYVSRKTKELLLDASTTIAIDEESETLNMTISSPTREFPNGNLGEIIREFLTECQEPQLVGFEVVVDIFAAQSADVVGGGRVQLYGEVSTIAVRTEF